MAADQADSLMLLLQEVLLERGTWCRTSTTRDWETITRRFEHEGLSFLTITLPAFGKDFEKSLDLGRVDRNLFHGFSWRGGLPRFLSGFLGLVFDRSSGLLLDDPNHEAIHAVRQLTLMFGKLSVPCSDARTRRAMAGYVECEQEVRRADSVRTERENAEFVRMVSLLLGPVLSVVDGNVYNGEIVPKHGSGSTADKLSGNAKYHQSLWTQRLEEVFPHGDFLAPNHRYTREGALDHVDLLEPGAEVPVKVISVPKTLKTPRIIAMEPTHMMYVQQGLMEAIVDAIQRDDNVGRIIGFNDQFRNNELARQGSSDGSLATLDLSEASDRVSNQLVRAMLTHHPHLAGAVDAARSRKADVAGHGVLRLAKFASMGSALTFPVEAMVFTTVVFLGIQDELNRPLTRRDVKFLRNSVRVYGDDIIVPVRYVQSVIARLEAFGLKVNRGKSFWTGKFRESCGKEYYDGSDVSIVRCRRMLPTSRKDADAVVSATSMRNQLYKAGSWRVAGWLDDWMSRVIPWPVVGPESSVQGRHSFLGFQPEKVETGTSMQRPLVKGAVVEAVIPRNSVRDEMALLKWLLKRGELPLASDHLDRSGRPDSIDIKIRWAPAF